MSTSRESEWGVKGERRGRGLCVETKSAESWKRNTSDEQKEKKNENCKGTSSDEMTMTDDEMGADLATNNMREISYTNG